MSSSRIRTYVLRQLRLTKNQQDAYVRLSPWLTIAFRPSWIDPVAEFSARFPDGRFPTSSRLSVSTGLPIPSGDADGPSGVRDAESGAAATSEKPGSPRLRSVVLEIGFGMGEATIELATENPDVGYIGVEVHKPGVGKVLSEIENRGLTNLLVVQYDAVAVLESMIRPGGLDGAHIFFPDPWPKKKHHKRRLIQPTFTRLLASRLRPGGYIYAVTDWEEYAYQMADVFADCPTLTNRFTPFAGGIPWRPTTAFERKGREKSHDIHELYVEKNR